MSPGSTLRRDEDNITSLTIDFDDQDFTRTAPTIGTITAFEFVDARGDERVNTENRYIPRTQEIHVGGLNMVWSNNDDWTIAADIGYAEQETERFDNQLGTQWNADDDDRDLRFEFMNGSYSVLGSGGYPVAYFEGVDEFGVVTPIRSDRPWAVLFPSCMENPDLRKKRMTSAPGLISPIPEISAITT